MAVIVPSTFDAGLGADLVPDGLKGGARFRRVRRLRAAKREHEPVRVQFAKFFAVPISIFLDSGGGGAVEGNGSTSPASSLRLAEDEIGFVEVNSAPLQTANFLVAQAAVQRQDECGIKRVGSPVPRLLDEPIFLFSRECAPDLL